MGRPIADPQPKMFLDYIEPMELFLDYIEPMGVGVAKAYWTRIRLLYKLMGEGLSPLLVQYNV